MIEISPVSLLESRHDRSQFDCGIDPLNVYLKQFALQNQRKGVVRNYVACRGLRIAGYYSLAFGSTAQKNAPVALAKGIGKYPIPLMILGRLAVDIPEKGKGLGKALLKDALLRTLQASGIAGLKAIFVQAKDMNSLEFYAKHGFLSSPSDPLHLFFPIDPLPK